MRVQSRYIYYRICNWEQNDYQARFTSGPLSFLRRRLMSRINHGKGYHTRTNSCCLWNLPRFSGWRMSCHRPRIIRSFSTPSLLQKPGWFGKALCCSCAHQLLLVSSETCTSVEFGLLSSTFRASSTNSLADVAVDCELLDSIAPPCSAPVLGTLISNRRSTGVRQMGQRLVWNLNTLAHSLHIHCDPSPPKINTQLVNRRQVSARWIGELVTLRLLLTSRVK